MAFFDGLVAKAATWMMRKAVIVDPGFMATASMYGEMQPQRMAYRYGTFAKEGYESNDTVYKCISYLSRNAANVDWGLYTDRSLKTEIDSHPLLDRWNNPNPDQDRAEFIEDWAGTLLLSGDAFMQSKYLTENYNINTPPDGLFVLRPDWVDVIPSESGIVGYKFGAADYNKIDLLSFEVAHTKYWAPTDLLRGLSPLKVASIFVDMQTAGNKWNLGLLQNSARPTGAWTTDQILDKTAFDTLKEDLNKKYTGYRNAGKAPVLYGGLKWQSMSLPPAELDWLNSRMRNAADIANIYNLAPMLIGDTSASTYNNMQEAKLASYLEAVFPMVLNKLQATANRWLVSKYSTKGTIFLAYKPESVPAIQQVIQTALAAQSDRGTKLYMGGQIMMDEARELSGFAPLPNGAGQVYRFGAILVKQTDLDAYAEQSMQKPAAPPMPVPENLLDNPPPAPNSNNGGNSNDNKPTDTGKSEANADRGGGNDRGKSGRLLPYRLAAYRTKALDLNTAEQKANYAASVETQRATWETELTKRLQEYFAQEHQAIHHAVDQAALPSTAALRAETALKTQEPHLKAVLLQAYKDVVGDFSKQTSKAFAKAGKSYVRKSSTDDFNEATIEYLLNLAGTKVTQIDQYTLFLLQTILAEGVNQGDSIPELAKRVDNLYLDQIIPNRSVTISRTEVVSSSNYGAMVAARDSGLTLNKVWLATNDNRTRPTHRAADGQTVPMDQPFIVGGSEMQQPGDSSAPASEVIDCRCTVYFQRANADTSSADDSEKSIIPMRPRRERYPGYRELLRGVAK